MHVYVPIQCRISFGRGDGTCSPQGYRNKEYCIILSHPLTNSCIISGLCRNFDDLTILYNPGHVNETRVVLSCMAWRDCYPLYLKIYLFCSSEITICIGINSAYDQMHRSMINERIISSLVRNSKDIKYSFILIIIYVRRHFNDFSLCFPFCLFKHQLLIFESNAWLPLFPFLESAPEPLGFELLIENIKNIENI